MSACCSLAAQVTLSWSDTADDEMGFVVQRSSDGVNYSQVAETAAGVSSYVDSNLPASTQYWYRVCATNNLGDSSFTNIAEVTTEGSYQSSTPASIPTANPENWIPLNLPGLTNSASESSASGSTQYSSGSAPSITSSLLQGSSVGVWFASYTIAATNWPTSYSAVGLPPGLSLNPSTGSISGTPESAGIYPVMISATNPAGTGSATLVLIVS
jgi:hypothetical protein